MIFGMSSMLRRAFVVAMFSSTAALTAAATMQNSEDNGCRLPSELTKTVLGRFPHGRIVSLSDLSSDDQVTFKKEHQANCPGASAVDFFGDGRPTYALSVVTEQNGKKTATLVVARFVDSRWQIEQLDTTDGPIPVVWTDKPGTYVDIYKRQRLNTSRPVVVWCAYESWASLYAWTGAKVSKIWIAD